MVILYSANFCMKVYVSLYCFCSTGVVTASGRAIVIGRFQLFVENYVVHKSYHKYKHAYVFLRSLSFSVAEMYKVCMPN